MNKELEDFIKEYNNIVLPLYQFKLVDGKFLWEQNDANAKEKLILENITDNTIYLKRKSGDDDWFDETLEVADNSFRERYKTIFNHIENSVFVDDFNSWAIACFKLQKQTVDKFIEEFNKKVSEKYKFEMLESSYYSWFNETTYTSLEVRVNIVEDDFLEMFIVERQVKPDWFKKFINWFVPMDFGLKDISYFRVKQLSDKDLSQTLLQVLQDLEKYKKPNKLSYLTNLNYSIRKA